MKKRLNIGTNGLTETWVDVPSNEAQTVPCPIHGNPLELKEQDGKLIAVCNCDVRPNPYAGNPVYESSIDKE